MIFNTKISDICTQHISNPKPVWFAHFLQVLNKQDEEPKAKTILVDFLILMGMSSFSSLSYPLKGPTTNLNLLRWNQLNENIIFICIFTLYNSNF